MRLKFVCSHVCVCASPQGAEDRRSDREHHGGPERGSSSKSRKRKPRNRKPWELDSEGEETSDGSSSEKVHQSGLLLGLRGSSWVYVDSHGSTWVLMGLRGSKLLLLLHE